MSKPIRVGLIRCDTHGAYFAPLMTQHDPTLFDQPVPMDQPDDIHYTWMAGGNHYYFYTAYPDPRQMTVPFIEGFDLVKLYDEHRTAAETLARVCMGRPQVCDDFEQVSNDVDLVFIADCNYDGSDHGKLATPGIEKGVPTFIDKPLASDTAGVKTILDLARRHRTVCCRASKCSATDCPKSAICISQALKAAAARWPAISTRSYSRSQRSAPACSASGQWVTTRVTSCGSTGAIHPAGQNMD